MEFDIELKVKIFHLSFLNGKRNEDKIMESKQFENHCCGFVTCCDFN